MNITSKSRYALKIMTELARHQLATSDENPSLQRSDIAKNQGIPQDYMDHILSRLRQHGLVESIRGRKGGYQLAVAAESITAWSIFCAAEDSMQPVACLEEPISCATENTCTTKSAWGKISAAVESSLVGITLDTLCHYPSSPVETSAESNDAFKNTENHILDLQGRHENVSSGECKAPSKQSRKTSTPSVKVLD